MRISLNLASRPFVELRPFFLRLRITMGVLGAVAIGLAIAAHAMTKKLDREDEQMDALRHRTIAFQLEKQQNESRMRQPANAAVLDRSHFLNALFLRKSFSWTAVMMDLETVLPIGVQVTSIEPSVTPDGDVVIRLRVSGDRDRAIQLVRNLERSKRFLMPRLNGETSQSKESNGAPLAPGATPGVEFEILANYNPLPEVVAKDVVASPAPVHHASAKPAGTSHNDGIVLKPYAAPPTAGQAPARIAPQGGTR
jgi:type IV pilus assembly protein PilN